MGYVHLFHVCGTIDIGLNENAIIKYKGAE